MRFTVAAAPSPVDRLTALAKTAQEYGYSAIALPDSIFYSEKVSADYPYTLDRLRFWTEQNTVGRPVGREPRDGRRDR